MAETSAILRIAVVSDLHCHAPQTQPLSDESFIVAGRPGIPALQHPIYALFELIARDKLHADLLLCPGDITNKACSVGLETGWSLLRELGSVLEARQTLATLGNHDVDSRHGTGADSMALPKSFRSDFPCKSPDRERFFGDGFYLYELDQRARVLVINTVIDHHDQQSAKRGTFSEARITHLRDFLSRLGNSTASGIALLHHHPLLHSIPGWTGDDVLTTGDSLLQLLDSRGFRFIIHGHRHHARVTTHNSAVVLATGSFSAILKEMGSYTRNLFHLVELDLTSTAPSGTVLTWEYGLGIGWRQATSTSASFPHRAGFGAPNNPDLSQQIESFLGSRKVVDAKDVLSTFPQLQRYSPSQLEQLQIQLRDTYAIKLGVDAHGTLDFIARIKP